MQYMGGKSRLVKYIVPIIQKEIDSTNANFVSLFCGACSIESQIKSKHKICNDKHEYLIEMWRGLQNGYILPTKISKEDYIKIKQNKDVDKVLTGFVGFACSFGGKWFNGYASCSREGRNYALEGVNSTMRKLKGLTNVEFTCLDFEKVKIKENTVIYCDPPYLNTTKYTTQFNHEVFWEYVRKLSKKHIVFISEQNAPEDFVSIFEYTLQRNVNFDKKDKKFGVEKLFIHKNSKYFKE